jgi:Cdc6-like AAA superfamily ATPase
MVEVYLCNIVDIFEDDYDAAKQHQKWGVPGKPPYQKKRDQVDKGDILILENKTHGAIIGKITNPRIYETSSIYPSTKRTNEVYPYRVQFDIIDEYPESDINDILKRCLKKKSGKEYGNPQALGMALRGVNGQFRKLKREEYCCIFEQMEDKRGGLLQKLAGNGIKCNNHYPSEPGQPPKVPEIVLDSKQKLPKNIILHGPVGTGKTFISNIIAQGIIENSIQNISKIEVIIKSEHNNSTDIDTKYRDKIKRVTFHKSYSYEDFIAGIKAVSENGNISYRIEDGIFKEFCDLASKNRGQNYVFIIDEINRGDISRIFGELITLIEEDKRGISINLPFKREGKAIEFLVPDNLYIIGTMNDSDRNIALIDVALRRRFTFFRVGFNEKLLEQWLKVLGDESSNKIKEFVKYLNEEIKTRMGEDYEIGHAFFAPIKGKNGKEAQDEVYIIFKYRIFPLLEEYFYSDREILTEFLKEFYEYDSSRKNENDRIPVIKAKEFKNFDELMSLINETLRNRE